MKNPVIFQESWIRKLILNNVNSSRYSNRVVLSEIVDKVRDHKTPIVRITQFFTQTKDNSITCQLADSAHRIFAVIPFETVVSFEQKHRRNLTSGTINNLIIVKSARLVFVGWREVSELFQQVGSARIDYLILEILDFDIFSRDNMSLNYAIENSIQSLYDDPEYVAKCGRKKGTIDFWKAEEELEISEYT